MEEYRDERKPIPFWRNPDGSIYYLYPVKDMPDCWIGDRIEFDDSFSSRVRLERRPLSFLERFFERALKYMCGGT